VKPTLKNPYGRARRFSGKMGLLRVIGGRALDFVSAEASEGPLFCKPGISQVEAEVRGGVVVTDCANQFCQCVEVIRQLAAVRLAADDVAEDSAEIFMAWKREERA
jgi:hypothetical protein